MKLQSHMESRNPEEVSHSLWEKRWWLWGWSGAVLLQAALFLLYYQSKPKRMVGDEGYYFNLAKAIARDQPAEHHPFWPPFYAESVGFIFNWFGEHVWLIQGLQVLLLWVSALLLARLTALALGSPLYGAVLGSLLLLSPEWAAFAHFVWPEVFHLIFMLLAVWLWMMFPQKLLPAFATGFSLGLALLSKLLLLPLIPLTCACLFICAGKERMLVSKRIALLALGLILTLAPTMLANKQRLGEFIIADSSLFNVWVGFNDVSEADYRDDIAGGYFKSWEALPGDWDDKKAAVRQQLVEQMNRNGWFHEALDQVPRQYRRLLDPQSFLITQLPDGPREAYGDERGVLPGLIAFWAQAWHLIILCLACIGIWMVRWRRPSFWWLMGGFLAYNLGLFLLVHVKTRFLLQMWPALLPFSLVGGLVCLGKLREISMQSIDFIRFSKPRVLGAALTILCLIGIMLWPR